MTEGLFGGGVSKKPELKSQVESIEVQQPDIQVSETVTGGVYGGKVSKVPVNVDMSDFASRLNKVSFAPSVHNASPEIESIKETAEKLMDDYKKEAEEESLGILSKLIKGMK